MAKRQSVLAAAARKAVAPLEHERTEQFQPREMNPAAGILSSRDTLLNEISSGRRRDVVHRLVEPEKCRMWRRHNRLYDRLDETNCDDLITQIADQGQKIPAIVRKVSDDAGGHEYEVICGARRHFAVSYLRDVNGRTDVLYLIEVRTLSDEEAFQLSDVENRSRRDISDYERGLDYHSALNEFYGGSASAMADRIGIPRQTLSHYLYLARLPREVIDAYGDPTQIAVRHGTILYPLLNNPKTAEAVRGRAAEIAVEQGRGLEVGKALVFDGPTVLKMLKEASNAVRTRRSRRTESVSVKAENGDELFNLERTSKFVTIRIPTSKIDQKRELINAIRKNLE